jgi:hypothetical protein
MLLSDASRDRFYLFAITGPSDYAALRGNVDPATIANAIVYTPPATGYQHEARLIGDVNGDGHNDIYVTWANAPFVVVNGTVRDSGIVFGRPATDAADRQRNVTYDITLRATLNICCEPGLPNLETYLLDDISGDGFPDLMLYTMSEFAQGSMTLIRSPVLRGPTPKVVDMTFATPDASNFTAYTTANIFEIDDLDADGIPSYLIGESAIDGDTLNAAPGPNVLDLDTYSLRFRAGTNAGFMAPIGNVTSDTVPDYVVSFNGQKGGLLFSGDLIKRAQTQPSPDPAFPGSRNIELRVIPYATFESLRPVNLGSAGLVAFGAASNDFSSTTLAATAGMIVLVKESDIRRSATTAPAGNVGIAPPLIVN